jgi:hypothetical protein
LQSEVEKSEKLTRKLFEQSHRKMIFCMILLAVLIVFAIQRFFERKKFYEFAENIPAERSYGILGHLPLFFGKDDEGLIIFSLKLC